MKEIFDQIKRQYCSLFSMKIHGDNRTLEIITPVSTVTDKFVSVFITKRGSKYVVADGGWTHSNTYLVDFDNVPVDVSLKFVDLFVDIYDVKILDVALGNRIYYKTIDDLEIVPSLVFDLANFVSNIVNAVYSSIDFEADKNAKVQFKKKISTYFTSAFPGRYKSNYKLANVKVSGAVVSRSKLHILEYVTGSSSNYFNNRISKAIVNFQIISDSRVNFQIQNKFVIVDANSEGFARRSPVLVNKLEEEIGTTYYTESTVGQVIDEINNN